MFAPRFASGRKAAHATALVMLVIVMATTQPGVAQADPDLTAPDPPTGVFLDQGSSWRSHNNFRVWWNNPPGQETPITVAHYELCPAVPPGPCSAHQSTAMDISELELSVPHKGGFWLRVWLEDDAGNVDAGAKSMQVMLRFDDESPPGAILASDHGWQGADTPASPSYVVEIDPASAWPVSGIGGYSLTVDGTVPDAEPEAFATQDYERFQAIYVLPGLPEGITTVGVRSVSNAGVPSTVVRFAEIRLDRSPPTLDDVITNDQWSRRPLSVALQAHDQTQLSGMSPVTQEGNVESGPHLAYELDGGPTTRISGGQGQIAVTTDGHHTLTYRAFDAAGNASVQKEASFKIDGTPPVGSFRALNPADPRQLKVDVTDATSGLADGRIEFRREGERGFRWLATTRAGGTLSARLDDEGLAAGRYELRAVATDVAGNEAVIDSWADGSTATVGMPLRLDANITVAANPVAKRCVRAAKRRGRKPRRKRAVTPKCRRAKPSKALVVGHGKRGRSTGRLVTGQGAPIANASIIVEGRPRSGGAFAEVGTARTDARGAFTFAIPAGPSRTLRYRYDGTNTVKAAAAELVTKVPAAARLKVSRRAVANGQAVRFTGRLLGKPIPSAGKLVALQAKVGRRWRTFATPRANARGLFRHRYRFTATTGVRRYAFRAVIAREAAYPYEAGMSRIVRVTVRGQG